ncbi:MAG: putative coagulation factor 5/8 type C domain-containing protein, partial [bacterium]
ECRYLRIQLFSLGQDRSVSTIALAELTLKPIEFGASREAFFGAIAREAPRGSYPRSMIGEPTYWTVVGADSSKDELLFSADGMLEIGKQLGSIEPFLELNGRRISWADADITQDRIDNLPIPRVTWNVDGVKLTITPFDHVNREVCVRYRIENTTAQPIEATLHLAIRPFQVNPPAQFLNFPGGTARLGSISLENSSKQSFTSDGAPGPSKHGPAILLVDDRKINVGNATLSEATFQQGDIVETWLATGRLPASGATVDPVGAASGILSYLLKTLPPGGSTETNLVISLTPGLPVPRSATLSPAMQLSPDSTASATFQQWQDESLARWKARSGNIGITLPALAQPLLESMSAQVGYILINRSGPAIQPGTRAYARSWIR